MTVIWIYWREKKVYEPLHELTEFKDRAAAMAWLNEHAEQVEVLKVIEGRALSVKPEQVVTRYELEG